MNKADRNVQYAVLVNLKTVTARLGQVRLFSSLFLLFFLLIFFVFINAIVITGIIDLLSFNILVNIIIIIDVTNGLNFVHIQQLEARKQI